MSGHTYRNNLISLVLDLSSFERQRNYQLRVPIANIVGELRYQWFDDLYMPASELFCDAFSEQEREALARLNKSSEAAESELPATDPGIEAYWKTPAWQDVRRAAEAVLIECCWRLDNE